MIAFADVEAEHFRDFAEPGFAKTVYELSVRGLDDGRTLLTGLMRTGAHVLVNCVLGQARDNAERALVS